MRTVAEKHRHVQDPTVQDSQSRTCRLSRTRSPGPAEPTIQDSLAIEHAVRPIVVPFIFGFLISAATRSLISSRSNSATPAETRISGRGVGLVASRSFS